METTRIRCVVCGKVTEAKIPRYGNKSSIYPKEHRQHGTVCEGSYKLGEPTDEK